MYQTEEEEDDNFTRICRIVKGHLKVIIEQIRLEHNANIFFKTLNKRYKTKFLGIRENK